MTEPLGASWLSYPLNNDAIFWLFKIAELMQDDNYLSITLSGTRGSASGIKGYYVMRFSFNLEFTINFSGIYQDTHTEYFLDGCPVSSLSLIWFPCSCIHHVFP